MCIKRGPTIHTINKCDNTFKAQPPQQQLIAHQSMKHRSRVSETCRFNHNAVKGFDGARITARQKISKRIDEIASNRATQTTCRKLNNIIIRFFDEQMVNAHVAKFIDHHAGVRKQRVLQK